MIKEACAPLANEASQTLEAEAKREDEGLEAEVETGDVGEEGEPAGL